MKINHNIAALNAYRNLATNNTNTAKSLEKLSSGLRINRAADDAAGLAISEKMRSQIRGLDMAGRNALDGISFIQTAEGALSSTQDILQRMNELAVQAANGTNTDTDRAAIQEEINQLTNEINRIGNSTQFNTQNLLDGSKTLGGATTVTSGSVATEPGQVTAGALSFDFTDANSTLNGYTVEFGTVADGTSDAASIDTANKKIIINGDFDDTDLGGNFSTVANIETAIEAAFSAKGGSFAGITVAVSGTPGLESTGTASSAISGGLDTVSGVYEFKLGTQDITIDGTTLAYDSTGATGWKDATTLAAAINTDGTLKTIYTASVVGDKIQLKQNPGNESATPPTVTGNGSSVAFQIGANDGQSISINISDMRAAALGLTGTGAGYTVAKNVNNGIDPTGTESGLDVTNANNAASAITIIQNAINSVSAERSRMGAVQNRLEHTVDNLKGMSENVTASESRIRDLDMALEMTNYTKNNILVQSAQAMLAQANQLPQGVLQLLK